MLDLTVIFSSPTTPENSHDLLISMTEGESVFVGGTIFRLTEKKYHRVENVTVTRTDGESRNDTNVSMSEDKYNIEELKIMISKEETYQSFPMADILT